jgi:hypothetical protein
VVGLLRQLAPLYNKLYDAAKVAMMPLPGASQAGCGAAAALLNWREGLAAKTACHRSLFCSAALSPASHPRLTHPTAPPAVPPVCLPPCLPGGPIPDPCPPS